MVRFLLEAGADQEHKTDEMHTALMEACMVNSLSFYCSLFNERGMNKRDDKIKRAFVNKQLWVCSDHVFLS